MKKLNSKARTAAGNSTVNSDNRHKTRFGFCQTTQLLSYGVLCTLCGALLGCQILSKPVARTETTPLPAKNNVDLDRAQQTHDTLAIRYFISGSYHLDKICRSLFTGLHCDSTIQQSWQLDSTGMIGWTTNGKPAGQDHYRFVAEPGAPGAATQSDTIWVLRLDQRRQRYLIRELTAEKLVLTEYPLVADNTTTYYLSRDTTTLQPH